VLTNSFLGGLASNFTNLDPICLSLVSGLLLFATYRKPWLLLVLCVGSAAGVALAVRFGAVPYLRFAAGISMLLLVAVMSLPERFEKHLIIILASVAMIHGMLHVNRWLPLTSSTDEFDFTLGLLIGLAFLSSGFGVTMKYLSEKSVGLFKEAEHILVATVCGAALISIVIGFL
jgi:general stress protein CsbA